MDFANLVGKFIVGAKEFHLVSDNAPSVMFINTALVHHVLRHECQGVLLLLTSDSSLHAIASSLMPPTISTHISQLLDIFTTPTTLLYCTVLQRQFF